MQMKKVSIDELCLRVTSGGTPSRKNDEYWREGTIDWLKTGELNDWFVSDSEEKISQKGLDGSSAKLFPENTVLMAMYGDGKTITTLGILAKKAATNQACCAMIVDEEKCNYLYLFYALKYHRKELIKLVVAGAQRNLSNGIIKNFRINYFPLVTQNKIVSALSSYDLLIENNRRRIQLLEESARLLYQEWFVQLRFPGHEQLKIVDGVPEGWSKEPLENLLILQRGFDLPVSKRNEGKVPIYASTGINGFHNSAKVKAPGVVTGRSGSLGTVMYVSTDFWPLNTTLWVKEFKKASPLFATFLLRAMKLEGYNGGAAVPTLNRNDVHKVDVLCPPAHLVNEFEAQVESSFKQVDKLKEYNEKLAQARDLLLPKLMSGELAL